MLTYIFTYWEKNLVALKDHGYKFKMTIQHDWPYLCLVSCLCLSNTCAAHTLVTICYFFCLRLEVHSDFETCWNSLVCQFLISNKIQNINTLKNNGITLKKIMFLHVSYLKGSTETRTTMRYFSVTCCFWMSWTYFSHVHLANVSFSISKTVQTTAPAQHWTGAQM